MKELIACCALLLTSPPGWADTHSRALQVEVKRDGARYNFSASFGSSLSPCAAYKFLTDYESAKQLPGVIESRAFREGPDKVRVERTADEHVLLFHVRMRSTMEYTEHPYLGVSFIQLSGDSRNFQGDWAIEANPQGSTFRFQGIWEPDTVIPLFVIDYFVENNLTERFNAMAQLAEKNKDKLSGLCQPPQLTASTTLIPNVASHE